MVPETGWPEVGRDALDPPQPPASGRRSWLPRRRLALGVRSTVAPTLIFILCGIVLGPQVLDVLSAGVLDRLDPVVSVALAVLGVFVGLGTTTIPRHAAREALVAGGLSSIVTIVIVGGGMALLLTAWRLPLPVSVPAFAGFLGICASASAAPHLGSSAVARRLASLADVDDVPLILLGTVAIAAIGGGEATSVLSRLALTVASGVGIGLTGWLLFEQAKGTPERGVYVTGAVLLMAGTGAYLGTSPLLVGGIAALVWVQAPGAADRIGAADLRSLQHPLLALLLIVAGAYIQWSPVVLWVAAAIVLLRLIAKILASFAIAPLMHVRPGLLTTTLLPPGVLGVALALNVSQVLANDAQLFVTVAASGAAATELLAMFLHSEVEDES